MDLINQDLRYAIRSLLKRPGFSLIVIFVLALGIGANTSVFSVIHAVLLKSLPYPHSDQLVLIWEENAKQDKSHYSVSPGNYHEWKKQNHVFQDVAAFHKWNYNLTGIREPERILGARVTANLFSILGTPAALGRFLVSKDDIPGQEYVVVLSDGFWKRKFGSDANIIGKSIQLDGISYAVVGVMPAGFDFPDSEVEFWKPIAFEGEVATDRQGKYVKAIARLKNGVTLDQAQADLTTIALQLEKQYPETNTGWNVSLIPLHKDQVRHIERALIVIWLAVGLVLLICCANVSSMFLARALERKKDLVVRAALGAGTSRLIRSLLVESFVFCLAGSVIAILFAFWTTDILIWLSPKELPRINEIEINSTVLLFAIFSSVLCAVLITVGPALASIREDLQPTLRKLSGGMMGVAGSPKLRSLLVILQIAICLVLLISSGLLMKSFMKLNRVDPGFNSKDVLTFRIWLPSQSYSENQRQIAFFQQLLERIKSIPEVKSAGAIQDLPLRMNLMSFALEIEGIPVRKEEPFTAAYRVIAGEYMQSLGIQLLRGRFLSEQDSENALPAALVNASMAKKLWPNQDPIGKRFRLTGDDPKWLTVVGVVKDVKHMGLDQEEGPAFYQPLRQKNMAFLRWMTIVVRTPADPALLMPAIRKDVQAIDPNQPLYDIVKLETLLWESNSSYRFSAFLSAIFAMVALLLSITGIYGVLSYSVMLQTREIGLRMALGATRKEILGLIFRRCISLGIPGVMIGILLALGAGRLLSSLVFDVTVRDPGVYLLYSSVLAMAIVFAGLIPGKRAGNIDPAAALRFE